MHSRWKTDDWLLDTLDLPAERRIWTPKFSDVYYTILKNYYALLLHARLFIIIYRNPNALKPIACPNLKVKFTRIFVNLF